VDFLTGNSNRRPVALSMTVTVSSSIGATLQNCRELIGAAASQACTPPEDLDSDRYPASRFSSPATGARFAVQCSG
jgi:hypothetical protein